jgi:GNAT superfamily N-acetyltransferase
MIAFPSGMRMATIGDEERIFALFAVAHADNGYGDMDPVEVRARIARGCRGESIVIAIIDGPERIEAVIALYPERRWYSTDALANWYNTDLLIYVHPGHRRSRHAAKLFQFAKWWANESGMPTVLGVVPKDDLAGKERLFARHGKKIGGWYSVGAKDLWETHEGSS